MMFVHNAIRAHNFSSSSFVNNCTVASLGTWSQDPLQLRSFKLLDFAFSTLKGHYGRCCIKGLIWPPLKPKMKVAFYQFLLIGLLDK